MRGLAFAIVAASLAIASAPACAYTTLFAFGDSLSDAGKHVHCGQGDVSPLPLFRRPGQQRANLGRGSVRQAWARNPKAEPRRRRRFRLRRGRDRSNGHQSRQAARHRSAQSGRRLRAGASDARSRRALHARHRRKRHSLRARRLRLEQDHARRGEDRRGSGRGQHHRRDRRSLRTRHAQPAIFRRPEPRQIRRGSTARRCKASPLSCPYRFTPASSTVSRGWKRAGSRCSI
jgi:hypothetical protein